MAGMRSLVCHHFNQIFVIMKSIVVYSSLSGFTKRYSEWISEELGADCVSVNSVDSKKLSEYDVVIFGSHIRMKDVPDRKRFAELARNLKKVIFFVVGGAPEGHNPLVPVIFKKINKSIPQTASEPQFYFQGGLNLEALPKDERAYLAKNLRMMKVLSFILFPARKYILNVVNMMSHNSDNSSKESIAPLVNYLSELK